MISDAEFAGDPYCGSVWMQALKHHREAHRGLSTQAVENAIVHAEHADRQSTNSARGAMVRRSNTDTPRLHPPDVEKTREGARQRELRN